VKRLALLMALVACSGPTGLNTSPVSRTSALQLSTSGGSTPIQHVVIIIQENRSVDNLFQFLPGANTQSWGYNAKNEKVYLRPVSMIAPFDLNHEHQDFLTQYAKGAMNGWNLVGCAGKCQHATPFGYVPQKEVQPYYTMAEQYAFADNMFQTNEGPTFPAHQYLVSGTSTISQGSQFVVDNNPGNLSLSKNGGCQSAPSSTVESIDITTGAPGPTVYPCFKRQTLMDLIMASPPITWRYYQEIRGPGLKHAPDAIEQIFENKHYGEYVKWPSSRILTTIKSGLLPSVAWVTPAKSDSDHPEDNNGTGPAWVASIVNAIGESKYWDNTAIFILWDDWGGWFDHVKPQIYNANELGFRVPLIVISAYTPKGYISTKQHEFGSILKYTEQTFGLGSLGTTDRRADNLSDCFDYQTTPRRFVPIGSSKTASYFIHLKPETTPLRD
jgi:phospholipase C